MTGEPNGEWDRDDDHGSDPTVPGPGPRETPGTFLLLAAFLAVFVAGSVAEARYGADLYRVTVVEFDQLGRVWTWVSALFLHVNAVHLALNSLFLALFGRSVERIYDTRTLLAVFFLTGVPNAVLGTLLVGVNRCGLDTFGATACHVAGGGSSIALAGLVGFVTTHRPSAPLTLVPTIRVPLWGFTGGFLVVSVLGMYGPVDPLRALVGFPPGHAYHFVGVLLGLALGSVWRPDG